MGSVTPLPMMKPDEAVEEIRRIAKEQTHRLYFSDHAEMRMIEREITRTQVRRILANGELQDQPHWETDKRTSESGWKCTFHDISAGARITAVAKLILV
ncbi:MAG: DUF4258 domain-containing protein, partial [Xanthomonadales bacterium]|nr:DUF4258 domain-containing protein [Xanthomonadales bacterium]